MFSLWMIFCKNTFFPQYTQGCAARGACRGVDCLYGAARDVCCGVRCLCCAARWRMWSDADVAESICSVRAVPRCDMRRAEPGKGDESDGGRWEGAVQHKRRLPRETPFVLDAVSNAMVISWRNMPWCRHPREDSAPWTRKRPSSPTSPSWYTWCTSFLAWYSSSNNSILVFISFSFSSFSLFNLAT